MEEGMYYRHSGHFGFGGLLAGLACGLLAGAPLAVGYSYGVLYIPIAGVVSLILSAVFGALVGAAAGWGLRRGKVRNGKAAALVALLSGSASQYFAWVVWVYAFLRRNGVEASLPPLLTRPDFLWEVVRKINAAGAWTIKGTTPTGWALWSFWGIEAAIVIGIAWFVVHAMVGDHPFCETCETWCRETEGLAGVGGGDPEAFRAKMEAKDFSFLKGLGPAKADSPSWFRLDLHTCPSCQGLNTLSVTNLQISTDSKGATTKTQSEVVKLLVLTAAEAESLKSVASGLPVPAAG